MSLYLRWKKLISRYNIGTPKRQDWIVTKKQQPKIVNNKIQGTWKKK